VAGARAEAVGIAETTAAGGGVAAAGGGAAAAGGGGGANISTTESLRRRVTRYFGSAVLVSSACPTKNVWPGITVNAVGFAAGAGLRFRR